MLTVRMTRTEHVVVALALSSVFGYMLWGALVGDLYVPSRHGPGLHMRGLPAYLVASAPLVFYVAFLVRGGLLRFANGFLEGAFELTLLFTGIALLAVGFRMASMCPSSPRHAGQQPIEASCKS